MLIPTLLIGFVVTLTLTAALSAHRDTFHPALLIGPMLAFHYCYSPMMLEWNDGFVGFLSDTHVERAQWIHLTGVLALCVGVLLGGKRAVTTQFPAGVGRDHFDRSKLFQGALLLGSLGIASFVYGINYVGGFTRAYGRAYGGGYAESGWTRDLQLLCLPALLLLSVAVRDRRFRRRELALALLFASPFLIHGLLGGRRGPTFVGLAGPAMLFYMARRKRPSLPMLGLGGVVTATLLLALVANRNSVYWGADLELEAAPSEYFRPGPGNDFIFGSAVVIVADTTGNFNWGTTYLVTLLVRPIPRSIWPTKYDDAADYLNRPSLEENLGIDRKSFEDILGWTASYGASPGIIGDMWREFSWGMLAVLLGIGWFYGYAWRRAVTDHANWVPIYCFAASLSIYLVMQTLEAMLYRFLFGVVPLILVLNYAKRVAPPSALTASEARVLPEGLT